MTETIITLSDPDAPLWGEAASKFEGVYDQKRYQAPLPKPSTVDQSLCYLGVAKRTRGKFDAKRAQALGIEKGKVRGHLANGETVTLEDGRVITPDMCVGQPDRSAVCHCLQEYMHYGF